MKSDTKEHQQNIIKVRAIDIRLTFRSKSKFLDLPAKSFKALEPEESV